MDKTRLSFRVAFWLAVVLGFAALGYYSQRNFFADRAAAAPGVLPPECSVPARPGEQVLITLTRSGAAVNITCRRIELLRPRRRM